VESATKESKRHSRARGREERAAEQERLSHERHERIRDVFRRMTLLGEKVTAKKYARETECTIDQARDAVQFAKTQIALLLDDDAYLEKMKAFVDAGIVAAWGKPDATAKLIEPAAKLRGYIQSGTTVNLMLAFQGTLFEGVKSAQELEARVLAEGKKLAVLIDGQCEQALRDVGGDVSAWRSRLLEIRGAAKQLVGGVSKGGE